MDNFANKAIKIITTLNTTRKAVSKFDKEFNHKVGWSVFKDKQFI